MLNKSKVLDHGYVAMLSTSNNGTTLQNLQDGLFRTAFEERFLLIATATMIVKCPLFVQLLFQKFNFNVIGTPSDDIEYYVPDESEITSDSLAGIHKIKNHIEMSTESLKIMPKGLELDGLDHFTSQILTPISVYNELVVHGNLIQWAKFCKQKGLPRQIENYRQTIEEELTAEWKTFDLIKKMVK